MKKKFNEVIGLFIFCLALIVSCKQVEQRNVERNKKVEIKSITFDGGSIESEVIEVYKPKADLVVEFAEKYEDVTLLINSKKIDVKDKIITHTVDGINYGGIDINIEIKQKDEVVKFYTFKVKLFSLEKDIVSFIFEGENINADSAINRNKKEIKVEKIADNGSTNVGKTTFFKLAVSLKYRSGKAHKFIVENKTTGESAESEVIRDGIIKVFVSLKNGDNNLLLNISKKGVAPISYKLIASYQEPEYKPITLIQFADKSYIGNEGLEKLLTGNEKMYSYGKLKLPCKIQMSETWYNDTDWTLVIDGRNIEKNAFVKENISPIIYNYSGICSLKEDEEKEINVVFENTRRTYKKEYKIKVKHENLLSFENIYFLDEKTKQGDKKEFSKYAKDGDVYKLSTRVPFKERTQKISCVIETKIEELEVKYAFSKTLLSPSLITTWIKSQREMLSYITEWGAEKEITGYVAKNELDYGESYFYMRLEKNGLKTCYVTPIFRLKVDSNDVKEEEHKLIYKSSDGTILEEKEAILATNGIILVKPKNPRATVKLLTPEAKPFTLNNEYFECEVSLNSKEIECSYEIIAENNVDKKTYNVKFIKPELVGRVRYAYKEDAKIQDFNPAIASSNFYNIKINKNDVVNNKFYLLIEAYKGLSLECSSLIFKKSKDIAGKTLHLFEADIVSLMNNEVENKDFSIDLSFNGKVLSNVILDVFCADEILDSILLFPNHYDDKKFLTFLRLPDNTYKLEGKFGNDNKKLVIYLNALLDEINNVETDRKIKIFDGVNEKEVRYRVRNKKVECSYTGLQINKGERKTFRVEYYKDKNDSSPIKTYTLIMRSL